MRAAWRRSQVESRRWGEVGVQGGIGYKIEARRRRALSTLNAGQTRPKLGRQTA